MQTGTNGAFQQKQEEQLDLNYTAVQQQPMEFNPQYEIYMHFAIFNGVKGFVITGNNEQVIL
jgi:hypothetical protein